jgi:hypothetical protein
LSQSAEGCEGGRGVFGVTPQQDAKRVQRAIRNIPVEQIAPRIATEEHTQNGMWCLVTDELQFVLTNGSYSVTQWDDPIEFALHMRYVQAHPERIHANHEEAVAFVRSQFANGNQSS